MSKITALRASKHPNEQVTMFLDGKLTIKMNAETVVKEGLEIGQELSAEQVEQLVRDLGLTQCLNTAYRYLSYRPRSEAEINERLQRRGFENNQIKIVINKLKEQNLLNDTAFAQFWKENREQFRPRSKRLTRLELKKKGVADDVISEVTGQIDDMESAYHAALGKAKRLPRQDFEVFRRRLGDYLKRRGFGYPVVSQTVKRTWKELEEQD